MSQFQQCSSPRTNPWALTLKNKWAKGHTYCLNALGWGQRKRAKA